MAITITTAMPTSFKVEVLKAVHNFTVTTGNVFKIALLKATAAGSGTYGAATTSYTNLTTDELASGSGYTTAGNTLTSVTPHQFWHYSCLRLRGYYLECCNVHHLRRVDIQ